MNITFGKYRNKSYKYILNLEPSYLKWVLNQSWFKINHFIHYEYCIYIMDIHTIDNNKDFIIYTDGACRNNGKKNMTGGIGIHFSHKNIMKMDDISEKLNIKSSTNNIAELMAIKRAMELTKEIYNVKIYTDSTYSINVITKWYDMWIDKGTIDQKKNIDIIKSICEMYKEKKVDLIHVKAHTGNLDEHSIGNMIADRLATESLKQ
jgi:ribonuclease HI